jgi:O-antigen/teichoic acid export membrane protein
MSVYDYGTLRQIMLLAVLVPTSIALGLPQSLSYFIPRAESAKEKKQLALQILICLSILGAAATILTYLLQEQISREFSNPILVPLAWIFSLYFLFIVPSKCAQSTLLAVGKINLVSGLDLVTELANFSFVVVPLLLGYGLEAVLLCLLAFYGIKFAVMLGILLSLEGGFVKLWDWQIFKAQLQYSLPLWLSFVVTVGRSSVDKFLVVYLYRPEDFAIYSRGAFELPLVGMVPFALANLLGPKFAEAYGRGETASIISMWREAARKVAHVFFPLFVFCFIFAEPIITLLFTSQYRGSVEIFRIYLCLLPIRIVSYKTILIATGTTKPILAAAIIGFVASVVLGIGLEAALGLTGPAIGYVIGEVLGLGFLLWHSKQVLNVSWSALIPTQRLAQPLLGAALVGMVMLPFHFAGVEHPAWVVVVYAVAYFGTYIAFMKFFRFFTEEDWALIRRCATLKVLRDLR